LIDVTNLASSSAVQVDDFPQSCGRQTPLSKLLCLCCFLPDRLNSCAPGYQCVTHELQLMPSFRLPVTKIPEPTAEATLHQRFLEMRVGLLQSQPVPQHSLAPDGNIFATQNKFDFSSVLDRDFPPLRKILDFERMHLRQASDSFPMQSRLIPMRERLGHKRKVSLSCSICEDVRKLRSALSFQLGAILNHFERLTQKQVAVMSACDPVRLLMSKDLLVP
jgi:hypothetical protein